MKMIQDSDEPKKKEITPEKFPPENPPASPEILPTPEKQEPFQPVPEIPVTPEPTTHPQYE
jgi:hypothetical protein